jgi:rod shape-determining protein MreC
MRDDRRTRIVLGVLLVATITLILLDVRGSSPFSGLRGAAGAVFGPVQRAVDSVVRPIGDFFGGIGEDEAARLDELERENDELRAQLRTSEEARRRAAELDALLRVAEAGQYQTVPARVIAIGPEQGFAWTVTIDAGSNDGIAEDMTVINGDGLVGRVKSVTASTAAVLLIVDPKSSVGARLEGTGELGVVSGQGLSPLQMQVLDPLVTVAEGARVVSFGSPDGTPFVPGVPIGEVISVSRVAGSLERVAQVRTYADMTALDTVGVVVQPPRTDPRDSVLPEAASP